MLSKLNLQFLKPHLDKFCFHQKPASFCKGMEVHTFANTFQKVSCRQANIDIVFCREGIEKSVLVVVKILHVRSLNREFCSHGRTECQSEESYRVNYQVVWCYRKCKPAISIVDVVCKCVNSRPTRLLNYRTANCHTFLHRDLNTHQHNQLFLFAVKTYHGRGENPKRTVASTSGGQIF